MRVNDLQRKQDNNLANKLKQREEKEQEEGLRDAETD
jgi:hypothetical protein